MRVYLREATVDDGKYIVKWRNSPSVKSHCFNQNPITEESNRRFFEQHVATGNYKQFIVERIEEQYEAVSYPIATVYLKDMDVTNKRCELCIFTSDDCEWNDESQAIAVRLLLDKAFNEYGMHKVYSYAFVEFLDEAELLKKAGFRVEAILNSEALNSRGGYSDAVRFCIFREDFVRS